MSLYYNDRTAQIKQKVMNVIKNFRAFNLMTDSEVKIKSLHKSDNNFIVAGDYQYAQPFLGEIKEKGTFKITLDEKLELVESDIDPQT
jgi:hypothetical protein